MDRFTAMETFISVIETGSFSGGARRMKVGQPRQHYWRRHAFREELARVHESLGVFMPA
jgi:hypothetical protein